MNKPPKKNGKDFLDILRTTPTPPPVESQPLTDKLPAPPAPPRQEFANFSSRISVANDVMLERVKFWLPGAIKQDIFNEAMRMHLESFPESQKPTPKELSR